jgi:hypothetical protein
MEPAAEGIEILHYQLCYLSNGDIRCFEEWRWAL